MKVHSIKQNNYPIPHFSGFKIAKIKQLDNLSEDVFIYSIDKNKDEAFCNKLAEKLARAPKERMNTQKPTIFQFIYSAFNSIGYADNAVLAVKGNQPFGFMSVMNTNSDKDLHLAYLATWKNPLCEKIKNGGSMLINHLLRQNRDKNKITLTPAFDSEFFYYRFGFEYEDEYTATSMILENPNIEKALQKLSTKFNYKEIMNAPDVDLDEVIKYEHV